MAKSASSENAKAPRPKPARVARSARAAAEPTRRKQAVVIVHGMGEQRPLETLRSFAEAVWGGSTVPDEAKPNAHNDLWIVPDTRAGLKELARVRTRNVDGVGTDFYELYWADKLTGNTLSHVKTWIFTLLLRWPHQVPRETFGVWLGLWAVTLFILGLLVAVGKDANLAAFYSLFNVEASNLAVTQTGGARWLAAAASALVAILAFIALRSRLLTSLKSWVGSGAKFKSTWQDQPAAEASLPQWLDRIVAIALPLLLALALFSWFPWASFPWAKGGMILAAIILIAIITGLVVPYVGDVARYVRASPDAVSARADIRERGLALMRALHGIPDPLDAKRYDFGDPTRYERIVVVGHSLGSMIAYDVLRLLWEEIGATGNNPPVNEVLVPLQAIDAYCKERIGNRGAIDPAQYRQLQADVVEALRLQSAIAPGRIWLISDFVTVGSPLTHAEFLVSPDRQSFEERKAERQFPTSPPMLEPGRDSFIYRSGDQLAAHHAAMFAATRWVNIYDPPRLGLIGDLIGGPCRPNFGPGIVDVPVAITRPGMFGRIFTHTHYWNNEAFSHLVNDSWKALQDAGHKLESSPPRHIAVLRLAMRLKRRIPVEPPVSDEI